VSREPSAVSGACFARPRSSWSPPLAPPAPQRARYPLCSSASQLLWRSETSHDRASSATVPHLPDTDQSSTQALGCWSTVRSPGFRTRSVRTCQGLRPRPVVGALAISRPSVLPSTFRTVSAPEMLPLPRLDGWPMRPPVNASPRPSRCPAHDSGSMWFATPSSWWTFTSYFLPA